MRIRACGLLLLLGSLAACGSDSLSGLRVTCDHGSAVQPLDRLEVRTQPATGQTAAAAALIFKNPLNRDQTETLRIEAGDRCTIGPAGKV